MTVKHPKQRTSCIQLAILPSHLRYHKENCACKNAYVLKQFFNYSDGCGGWAMIQNDMSFEEIMPRC